MTAAHFIYIPMVAICGMMLGFIFGARAARNAYDLEMRREEERAAARAARAKRKAARAAQADAADADDADDAAAD
jgi:hypothetical protein